MIRAIYIIVEGPTEEEYVKNLLQPYFANQHNFPDIRAIKMETSPGHKGGDISFARYRRNVELLLKRENDIMVTSLIDFYKLRTDFPSYEEAKNRSQVEDKVSYIEHYSKEIRRYVGAGFHRCAEQTIFAPSTLPIFKESPLFYLSTC